MDPDPAIERLAERTGGYVIWGVRNLLADLEEIVRSRRVSEALGMDRIAREVHGVTDGLICLEQFREGLRCRRGGSTGFPFQSDGNVSGRFGRRWSASMSRRSVPAAGRRRDNRPYCRDVPGPVQRMGPARRSSPALWPYPCSNDSAGRPMVTGAGSCA